MSRSSCGGRAPDYKLKWEEVARDTDRLRIDEGWIYRTRTGSLGDPAMVFVPNAPTKPMVLDPKPNRALAVEGKVFVHGVSTQGSPHEGCPKNGTWRDSGVTMVDRCDGCGEERA
jgi:hypothetical protein